MFGPFIFRVLFPIGALSHAMSRKYGNTGGKWALTLAAIIYIVDDGNIFEMTHKR
jgi:hypothetical protein